MRCFDRLLLWSNCFLVLVLLTGRAHSTSADIAPSPKSPKEADSSLEDDTAAASSESSGRVGLSAFFPMSSSNSGRYYKTHYDSTGKRNPGMYSFGLGKRSGPQPGIYNFGLGKRGPPGSLYNFGLGKRAATPGSLYNFGLGKRPEMKEGWADVKSNNGQQRFNFGLGKRGGMLFEDMLDEGDNDESGEFLSSSEDDQEDRPISDKRSDMTNGKPLFSSVYLRSPSNKKNPWELNNMVGKRPYNFGLGK